MKKVYLSLFAILMTGIGFAQSFTIITPLNSPADLVTAPNTDVTGDTVVYSNPSSGSAMTGFIWVINTSGSALNVKLRRTNVNVVAGSTNSFCWDLCYGPGTSLSSGTVSIPAGDTAKVFVGDYNPNGYAGNSFINYKVFNAADTTDEESTTIRYAAGLVGLDEEVSVLSSVYPNPASQYINFDYTIGNNNGTISIADMTGKIVRTIKLPENSTKHVVSLDGFIDGIYIYTFYSNNKAIATKKFIVRN